MGTNVFGYVYDSIGNRRWATNNAAVTEYLANELNQYLSVTSVSSVVSLSYDSDGNLTNDGTFAYTWDAENRLMAVYSNETAVLQNSYDYMSRRVEKATAASTNRFIYDGWNMIRETQVSGFTSQVSSFVWGLDLSGTLQGAGGVGGLLSVVRGSWSAGYVYDANGNVTDVVDTNGNVAAHYEYDPYGNPITTEGAEAQSNPYRFSTKYEDDETGLLYYGFRYYSPEIGRWLSRDPVEERGFSVAHAEGQKREIDIEELIALISRFNPRLAAKLLLWQELSESPRSHSQIGLYTFVDNDPLSEYDYLGLACGKELAGAILGVALGAAGCVFDTLTCYTAGVCLAGIAAAGLSLDALKTCLESEIDKMEDRIKELEKQLADLQKEYDDWKANEGKCCKTP